MTLTGFGAALEHTNEIERTTTGRVTGKPISCPVWFVRRGGELYLVPGMEHMFAQILGRPGAA
jgi:hypothetical protein